MTIFRPINLEKWIVEHQHLLQPPVNNKQVFDYGDFVVMVVGGPNERADFHINQTGELFYQLKGKMDLRIKNEQGRFEDIQINEGDLFLLPPRVPHSPQRYAKSLGIVVEQKRRKDEIDSFVWYCDHCGQVLHTVSFVLTNIEIQVKAAIDEYWSHPAWQKCSKCQTVKLKK
jgi:3-hydroxyanthranilate 3,4-dioxygenase